MPPKNSFTDAVEAAIKLAQARCAEHPECEQMQLQVQDLRNCLFREQKAEIEIKAKAEFAAAVAAREQKAQAALDKKIAAGK